MIRLGTVFSGIGAIEQAFIRMNVPHKIVFACDNGERDISLSQENIDEIERINIIDSIDGIDKIEMLEGKCGAIASNISAIAPCMSVGHPG